MEDKEEIYEEDKELDELAENLADGYSSSILSGIYSVNNI